MQQQPPDSEIRDANGAGILEPVPVMLDEDFRPEPHHESDLDENARPVDLPAGEYRAIESIGDPVDVEEHRDDDQTGR